MSTTMYLTIFPWHHPQRDQILQEQKGHITVLRQQAKEQQRNLEQKGEAHKEQVEEALRHNQELSRNKTRELHGRAVILKVGSGACCHSGAPLKIATDKN